MSLPRRIGLHMHSSASDGTEAPEELLAPARRHALYVTAGSDYHGKNKTARMGDTKLPEAGELPEGLRRFPDAAQEKGMP